MVSSIAGLVDFRPPGLGCSSPGWEALGPEEVSAGRGLQLVGTSCDWWILVETLWPYGRSGGPKENRSTGLLDCWTESQGKEDLTRSTAEAVCGHALAVCFKCKTID